MTELEHLPAATPPAPPARWAFQLKRDGALEEELHTNTDATCAATLRAVADQIDPHAPPPVPRSRWRLRRRKR